MKNNDLIVSILIGSKSDKEVMNLCQDALKDFGIKTEMRVLSAHRTPDETVAWVRTGEERGVKVFIAAAGLSAHLAGVVAANTSLPVIGVPLNAGSLNGMDSLLSTVQMPKGVPVATVAIGKHGAINAALLAVRILSLVDNTLQEKLIEYKNQQAKEILDS